MRIISTIFLSFLFCPLFLQAQALGNQGYGDNEGRNYNERPGNAGVTSSYSAPTSSAFTVTSKIMMNVVADQYVLTLGISEEAKTARECSIKMEKRIGAFRTKLIQLGISGDAVYVDMITQHKIYDYKVSGKTATEVEEGMELKKNIIVRFSNSTLLDKILLDAADLEIYDVVKVDYVVSNMEEIYAQLYREAMNNITLKRDRYIMQNHVEIANTWRVLTDRYQTFYPDDMYKTYTAYETGNVHGSYNTSYMTREKRKSPTQYYDKLHYSGFDKVINPVITEPVVEFTYSITVQFEVIQPKQPAPVPTKKNKRN